MKGISRLAVITCLSGLLLLLPLTCAQAGVSEKLREGCRQLVGGRWIAAGEAFRQAAREDVRCAEALTGEGTANLLAGNLDAAQRCFEQALVLQADHRPALVGQATARFLRRDYDPALQGYRLALSYPGNHRAALRASLALTACLLGLYESSEAEARAALQEEPGHELGLQVLAAAYVARNRTAEALQVLSQPIQQGYAQSLGLTAPSPLFSPTARYYGEKHLAERERLAQMGLREARAGAQSAAAAPAQTNSLETTGDPNFRILWPRPGALVQGKFEITVHAAPEAGVQYIAVLVDEQFAGMSNSTPFRLHADSSLARDGLRDIRVDGYGADGSVACSTTMTINIANGQQTLSPEEAAVRAGVGDFLCGQMLLQAHPLQRAQIIGHAHELAGRFAEAVDAYEYAFSYEPTLPGIRAGLLAAYRNSGLLDALKTHEIHALPGTDRVALTFDDGPHPVLTPWILDLLDRYQAKATFLLVGKQVEMYPELAREIVRRGHEVGSHSYTHANMRRQSTLAVERELVMSRQVIRRATGEFVTLFRPPGGNYDAKVRDATQATGFTTVFWTENITSYPGLKGEVILPRMIDKIGRNGIVLLHNGYDETPDVLPLLLPALTQRGLRMDTISALHPHQPFKMQPVTIYPAEWKL